MKIFQLSDYEWFYGVTLDAAFEAAIEITGVPRKEWEQDFQPKEVSEPLLSKPGTVNIADDADKTQEMVSFREALEYATQDGSKSGLLCGIE